VVEREEKVDRGGSSLSRGSTGEDTEAPSHDSEMRDFASCRCAARPQWPAGVTNRLWEVLEFVALLEASERG
jgi:hypothetical protein